MQLPAPASSLAVPPPSASTAEAADLSVGATILEDSGPAAAAAAAAAVAASTHQFFIFLSLPLVYCSCLFAFGHISQVCRVYVLVHGFKYCYARGIIGIVVPCI